ncbi:keratin, type I cytoskeletal 9-like [Juglans microcarpa x Juglans regia]|uniref:keratin, type I cytoskeletal 9-like n=1 Tax=Juglans microcarpa x Juglans regia TaxID=2249226 RepID=UPI001B7F1A94|nr:keratin, type I cytoskeletal 9-like [Juglans microcarpa x Juglans regia]
MTNTEEEHHYVIRLTFKTTNNEVKYETLLAGLSITEALGAVEIEVRVDFQVIINQVLGEFEAKGGGEPPKEYEEAFGGNAAGGDGSGGDVGGGGGGDDGAGCGGGGGSEWAYKGGEWCTEDVGGGCDCSCGGGGEHMTGHVAQSLIHSAPIEGTPIS